jgi:hypothetical protein
MGVSLGGLHFAIREYKTEGLTRIDTDQTDQEQATAKAGLPPSAKDDSPREAFIDLGAEVAKA